MSSDIPIGIIELGNVNTKCIIFRVSDNNASEILSTSMTRSEGVHNGDIVNLASASKMIRSCISIAEKEAKVSLKKMNVILEQPEFLCTKFSKHKKIDGSKIHNDDIKFLLSEAKKQLTLNDDKQSIIHIFNHNYIVDGKTFLKEPVDVYADYLSHEMTFITMPKNNIKNINQAFIDCDIEVGRIISCTFALGAKLLDDSELQTGSTIMDIGFEKISLGFFKNFALVHSITFPIGINHIVKDISKVCSLSLEESELITKDIDFLFQNNQKIFDNNDNLKDAYFKNSNYRKISQSLILNVVKARLDEMFGLAKKQIFETGSASTYITNILIVGGGSNLFNLEKYCSNFFEANVKTKTKNYKEEKESKMNQNFAACLGAIKIIKDGWETEAIPEVINKNIQKISFFGRIFGNRL